VTHPARLLFVCTGNVCRSPIAATLAELRAVQLAIDLEVRSAGTAGLVGVPASKSMVAVAREAGLDLTAHRSQALTAALIDWADQIAVMELRHGEAVSALVPGAVEKVVPLGPLVGTLQIDDPHGRWLRGPYRRARDELRRAVALLLPSVS